MATKETRKAPAEKPTQSSQQTQTPPDAYSWGQEDATGFEGTRAEDLGIPFLSLLQKGSPEVDENHPDHESVKIEGVKAGMIINTLTREIVYAGKDSQPLQFVPVFHQKLFQEWKPRSQGGGFIKSHPTPAVLTQCKRNEKNEDVLPSGNIIRTTSYFSGFLIVDGNTNMLNEDETKRPTRCIIAMSSTQLKKARMWLNMMHSIKVGGKTPPMYSHIYDITSLGESNEKGNWYGFKIEINRILMNSDLTLIQEGSKTAAEMGNSNNLLAAPSTNGSSGDTEDDRIDEEAAQANRREARRATHP